MKSMQEEVYPQGGIKMLGYWVIKAVDIICMQFMIHAFRKGFNSLDVTTILISLMTPFLQMFLNIILLPYQYESKVVYSVDWSQMR